MVKDFKTQTIKFYRKDMDMVNLDGNVLTQV